MEEKAKNTPKKKKKPFVPMEMAKVPLDRDQAVLSCCQQPQRGSQGFQPGTQCEAAWCPVNGWGAEYEALSS